MTEIHQTLKFGDLPTGTKFHHPKTNEVYQRTILHALLEHIANNPQGITYNAISVGRKGGNVDTLIHPDTVVTLTSSIDFYSIEHSAKFAYDQKVFTKIARNRARHKDTTKYFEPDDSVSPL